MAKTINFCGDSFCADLQPSAWTSILANLLGYNILGGGKAGSAHEHAIQSFDKAADITVFCWTDANRVYHPTYLVNSGTAKLQKKKNPFYAAAYAYYYYVHDWQHSKVRQMRELYWFDHEVLSQYSGNIVHCWCFDNTYDWTHGIVYDDIFCEGNDPHLDSKRINHFTIEENKILADKMYNFIRRTYG